MKDWLWEGGGEEQIGVWEPGRSLFLSEQKLEEKKNSTGIGI